MSECVKIIDALPIKQVLLDRVDLKYTSPRMPRFAEPVEMPGSKVFGNFISLICTTWHQSTDRVRDVSMAFITTLYETNVGLCIHSSCIERSVHLHTNWTDIHLLQLLQQRWKNRTEGAQNMSGSFGLIPFRVAAGPEFC